MCLYIIAYVHSLYVKITWFVFSRECRVVRAKMKNDPDSPQPPLPPLNTVNFQQASVWITSVAH